MWHIVIRVQKLDGSVVYYREEDAEPDIAYYEKYHNHDAFDAVCVNAFYVEE